jgi:hypothetical protein
MPEISQGKTFFLPGRKQHLAFVLNKPEDHDGTALVVNVTTQYTMSDTSCRVYRGEHSFIEHASVIYYAGAQAKHIEDIARLLSEQIWLPCDERVTQALIDRALAGARMSPEFAPTLLPLL